MSIEVSDITWLHVEASTRCNAWCPACPRTLDGHTLRPGFTPQDLDLDRFLKVLDTFPNLETIQLCGNDGDPIAHNNINELIAIIVDRGLKIQLHTNGGLKSAQWWNQLGLQISSVPHTVWFGIDGIGPTHEIYRQGTSYDKVIENAQAFINAGGEAIWQFIPFKHNEHQIMDAIKTSQALGFRDFKLVKSFRETRTQARHWRTGESFTLEPADVYHKILFVPQKGFVTRRECMHLSIPSVYLGANGRLSHCCYFHPIVNFDTAAEVLDRLVTDNFNAPKSICLTNCDR